jgi:hypothetical protein
MTWITFVDNVGLVPKEKKYNLYNSKLYSLVINDVHILKIIKYNLISVAAKTERSFFTYRKFYIKIKNLNENNMEKQEDIFRILSTLLIGKKVKIKDITFSNEGIFQGDVYLHNLLLSDILTNLGICLKKKCITFNV